MVDPKITTKETALDLKKFDFQVKAGKSEYNLSGTAATEKEALEFIEKDLVEVLATIRIAIESKK